MKQPATGNAESSPAMKFGLKADSPLVRVAEEVVAADIAWIAELQPREDSTQAGNDITRQIDLSRGGSKSRRTDNHRRNSISIATGPSTVVDDALGLPPDQVGAKVTMGGRNRLYRAPEGSALSGS